MANFLHQCLGSEVLAWYIRVYKPQPCNDLSIKIAFLFRVQQHTTMRRRFFLVNPVAITYHPFKHRPL